MNNQAKATIFQTLYDKTPYYRPIGELLTRIREGKSKDIVERVRSGEKELKNELPIVYFSGEFTGRGDSTLVNHSGFIVIDIDHVNVEKLKPLLSTDEHTYACWISPSGDGLKLLVRISHPERHRDHFNSLSNYFLKNYGVEIDSSGKNEARACFESYDPEIIVNEDSAVYGAFATDMAVENKGEVVVQRERYTDYMKLNNAARMVRLAMDGEKHNQLLKAAVLCGGYIAIGKMEEDEAVRVLEREISKRDIVSFDQAKDTIQKGIQKGKEMPVREIIEEEKKSKRDLLIYDGDMSFVSSDDEDFRWISDFAEGKIEMGLSTGSDKVDKHFLFKKEFVVINGHSNVGKTTFNLYLIATSAMLHGWRWCIYSSENTTASTKMRLMEFVADRRISEMSREQRILAYRWVKEHFIVFGNRDMYSYTDILLFAEKTMTQFNVDAIFVDPYNSLKIEISQNNKIGIHEYHYDAASEFLSFSKNRNVGLWLNAHAVTEAQRRKGEDGLPVAPWAEDTESGGKWVNRCDSFLTVHRKVQSPDHQIRKTTELHVRKVRNVETGGMQTPYNEPILFEMNTQATGFHVVGDGYKKLFAPISNDFDKYKTFNKPEPMEIDLGELKDIF